MQIIGRSLREARSERGAEEDARLKVAAALAGKVKFRSLEDGTGRVEVEYATGRRSACKREVITDIPVVLLPAILNLVASDTDPVRLLHYPQQTHIPDDLLDAFLLLQYEQYMTFEVADPHA